MTDNRYKMIELWNDFATNIISNNPDGVALVCERTGGGELAARLAYYNQAKNEWPINENEYIMISYSNGDFYGFNQIWLDEFLTKVERNHKKWLSENPDTLPQLLQYKKLFKFIQAIC